MATPNFSSKRRKRLGESGAAPQMTKRSVFVSASSAPGALSNAASIVGTEENVTGSNSPTFVQNSVAEKRSHIAACAPISIGSIIVTGHHREHATQRRELSAMPLESLGELRPANHDARARVGEDLCRLTSGERRVDRIEDAARPENPPPCFEVFGTVGQDDRDDVARLDA